MLCWGWEKGRAILPVFFVLREGVDCWCSGIQWSEAQLAMIRTRMFSRTAVISDESGILNDAFGLDRILSARMFN
jgi:hypothetical protein